MRFQPNWTQLAAEPGHLAFGELAGFGFYQLNYFSERTFAAQMFDHLAIANRLHGGFVLFKSARQQALRFLHQTAGEHVVHTSVDAPAQIIRTPRETKDS